MGWATVGWDLFTDSITLRRAVAKFAAVLLNGGVYLSYRHGFAPCYIAIDDIDGSKIEVTAWCRASYGVRDRIISKVRERLGVDLTHVLPWNDDVKITELAAAQRAVEEVINNADKAGLTHEELALLQCVWNLYVFARRFYLRVHGV